MICLMQGSPGCLSLVLAVLFASGTAAGEPKKPAPPASGKVQLVAQIHHTAQILAVKFSPNGKQALTASADNTAVLWDVGTGQELRAFQGHGSAVTSVAFSPDGKQVLTGSYDDTAMLWDTGTGRKLRTFKGHKDTVFSVAFSPDGKQVLTAAFDKTAVLWDAGTGQKLRTFRGHWHHMVTSAAFSPDGKQVLTGCNDKQVMILDTCAAGAAAKKLTEQRNISGDQIRAIDRLKDRTGFHILMGCASDKVSFEATQYEQGLLTHALLKGMRGAALDRQEFVDVTKLFEYAADEVPQLARNIGGIQKPLIASPRGSGSFDVGQLTKEDKAKVRLAIPKPLLLRPRLTNPDEGDDTLDLMVHLRKKLGDSGLAGPGAGLVYVDAEEMAGAIRPTGNYAVEGNKVKLKMFLRQDNKTLATFQVEGARDNLKELTGRLAEAIEQEVRKLAPGHRAVDDAAAPDVGRGAVLTNRSLEEFVMLVRWLLTLCGLFLLPQCVAAGEGDRKDAPEPGKHQPVLTAQLGHSFGVTSAVFATDGKLVLTGSSDKTARLWDAFSGRELRSFLGHADAVTSVAFVPDGKQVLTGSSDKTARLWDALSGKQLRIFTGHGDAVSSVAFSPDGKQVLTGSLDKTARLWDAANGKQLHTFTGHGDAVTSVAFARVAQQVLTGSSDKTARLWDAASGKQLHTFAGHDDAVTSVALAPNGTQVLTGSLDRTARSWDAITGKQLRVFTGHVGAVSSVAFAPDNKQVLTGSWDNRARLWDAHSGAELCNFRGHAKSVACVSFGPNGKLVLTGSADETARSWDAHSGKELRVFSGPGVEVFAAAFAPDGKQVLTGCDDRKARLWDVQSGKELRALAGHAHWVFAVAFAPDGKQVLTGGDDRTARLWDAHNGKELRIFKHAGQVFTVAFSRDGKQVLTGGDDRTARLWDAHSGKELLAFTGHANSVVSVAFAPDGKQVLTGSLDKTARLWDAQSGKELHALTGHSGEVGSAAFSPDGTQILTGSWDHTARLWDAHSGKELRAFKGHTHRVVSVAFAPDGKQILTGSWDHTARLWDTQSGQQLRTFAGHTNWIYSVAFAADGKHVLSASEDSTTRIWETATGRELCKLFSFSDGTWAVVDADGRFDAANAGDIEGLHWVAGHEPIALTQLKERYYDPGLLAKYMGFNKEPVRKVDAFKDVKLFPSVQVTLPENGARLALQLANQGGGIGKVQVFVNGKELLADARGPAIDPGAKEANLTIDLTNAPSLKPGENNNIEVVTWNQEGYLSSRSTRLIVKAPGQASSAQPELYAIVAGVSDYASPTLKLKYAAKDAEDMAQALELGARRLLGVDKVHLTLLTTSKDGKNPPPTRANLQKAFEQARQAKPGDVLIVYLAGHGMAMPGSDDVYCYLTSEARGTDLSDPAIREQYSITSTELTDWIKKIPALKQVMILDTCAAGAAARKLTEQRQISGDQIRAIDRLKDRTGFHILMGCASDRVSFEATQYEQGLLTHALLKGMRGAALDRQEFVDVAKLFQYAADEVPQLARNIGGIQKPLIASPRGSGSFDVGQLTNEDKAKVRLAVLKPLLLKPLLTNAVELDDTLGLMPRLRKKLEDNSGLAGRGAAAVYVDAEEMPGAIRPAGSYVIEGSKVRLKMVLRQDGKTLAAFPVEGAIDNLEDLTIRLAEAIEQQVRKLPAGAAGH